MITKKKFIECIEYMQELDKIYNRLEHLGFYGIAEDLIDVNNIDLLISVIEESLNIPVDLKYGSTLSWWIYDCKFGKIDPYVYIKNKNKTTKKIKLDSISKLYDYLLTENVELLKNKNLSVEYKTQQKTKHEETNNYE